MIRPRIITAWEVWKEKEVILMSEKAGQNQLYTFVLANQCPKHKGTPFRMYRNKSEEVVPFHEDSGKIGLPKPSLERIIGRIFIYCNECGHLTVHSPVFHDDPLKNRWKAVIQKRWRKRVIFFWDDSVPEDVRQPININWIRYGPWPGLFKIYNLILPLSDEGEKGLSIQHHSLFEIVSAYCNDDRGFWTWPKKRFTSDFFFMINKLRNILPSHASEWFRKMKKLEIEKQLLETAALEAIEAIFSLKGSIKSRKLQEIRFTLINKLHKANTLLAQFPNMKPCYQLPKSRQPKEQTH